MTYAAATIVLLPFAPVGAAPRRVSLEILEPAERRMAVKDFPVAVGLVFPDGELTSLPGGRIVDNRGTAVPFDAEATGWWDGAHKRIRWLLLKFAASTD